MMNLIFWSALIKLSNHWSYSSLRKRLILLWYELFKQKIIFSLFLLIHAMKQKKKA